MDTHSPVTCGIDEAGRGAFAGPLVAAAVLLTPAHERRIRNANTILRDSKKMTAKQREKTYRVIRSLMIPHAVHVASVSDINKHGIGWANVYTIEHLIAQNHADRHIVDGALRLSDSVTKHRSVSCVIDADATILAVMLAGIVAKVTRDTMMKHLHPDYPHYHWEANKGYGTKQHIEAIRTHGMCRHHREIFVMTALSK